MTKVLNLPECFSTNKQRYRKLGVITMHNVAALFIPAYLRCDYYEISTMLLDSLSLLTSGYWIQNCIYGVITMKLARCCWTLYGVITMKSRCCCSLYGVITMKSARCCCSLYGVITMKSARCCCSLSGVITMKSARCCCSLYGVITKKSAQCCCSLYLCLPPDIGSRIAI